MGLESPTPTLPSRNATRTHPTSLLLPSALNNGARSGPTVRALRRQAVAYCNMPEVSPHAHADERALTMRAFYAQPCILSHGLLDLSALVCSLFHCSGRKSDRRFGDAD